MIRGWRVQLNADTMFMVHPRLPRIFSSGLDDRIITVAGMYQICATIEQCVYVTRIKTSVPLEDPSFAMGICKC